MTTINAKSLTRRDFLKSTGVAAFALWLAGATPVSANSSASSGEASADAFGVLIDVTRCQGCNSCALACKKANGMPDAEKVPDCLDSSSLSFVDECGTPDSTDANGTRWVKRQCMHCLHPGCVSACTVGALRKTAEGPVTYDSSKCIGCRYCQYACPFGVPTYDWGNPLGLIHKCELCNKRLNAGEQPACVAACPTGAVQFGRRKDLLAQAHARINSAPDRYLDKVYGEFEAGGTSVLYLSDVPFEELGLPTLSDQSVPHYAESVMVKTPVVAASVAALATGIHFTRKNQSHHDPDQISHDHDKQEDPS
ncbi:MAG: 4Fe-4S binding protein [Caldilineales bacterium]|nr:4Fe-4S binding protein [Caldilineales bacterium]